MSISILDNYTALFENKIKISGFDCKPLSGETEVIILRSRTRIDRNFIEKYPNLKLIIRGGVGLDNIDLYYASEKGIMIKNTPKASSIAVAELAFAHLIAISSLLIEEHNSMKKGVWLKNELKRTELYGKTICLVGLGNIGLEMAKRCHSFGMKVIAYKKTISTCPYADVWDKEPPDDTTLLYRSGRVFMTPHIGASTVENLDRVENEIITILKKFKKEN